MFCILIHHLKFISWTFCSIVWTGSAKPYRTQSSIKWFCGSSYYPRFCIYFIELLLSFCIRALYVRHIDVLFIQNLSIDWLIDWCLTPTLAIFQLYRDAYYINVVLYILHFFILSWQWVIIFLVECTKEEGRVYAVDSHPIMMKEREGRMTPHFGQDSLMVYTTHKCTLSDHVSQLTKVKNEKPDCVSFLSLAYLKWWKY